jgi:hypothetical protein
MTMQAAARTLFLTLAALPCAAAAQDDAGQADHAVGADLFYQSDADGTEVVRAGADLDPHYRDKDNYTGIRLEKAWFNPIDQGWQGQERVYLRAARELEDWTLKARVGTDGDTVLGSVTAHDNARFRKEFFVERDILETPQGLARGIYYTFAGAAVDVPLDDRSQVTLVAGVQEFTGENVRLHLRANYIHVIKPELGLSAQLRTRFFRNSEPREADYYSPRWYAQVLPVLQMRRTTEEGWRFLLAGGLGVQRDSSSGWRRASYAAGQVTSPEVAPGWAFTGGLLFTETPTASGQSYSYFQTNVGIVRAF